MLRYIACGPRNFKSSPVPPCQRLNWEFYAITDGYCGPYFTSGTAPALRTGVLWLLPAQSTYGWRGDGKKCQRIALHFSTVPEEVREAMGERRFLVAPIGPPEKARLAELARELDDHWKSPHQYSHLVCEKALLELSLLILKHQPLRKEIPLENIVAERVERAISWFTVNMTRNPSVDEVAAAMHVSGTHLRRLFKQALNQSPHAAFRKVQIKRATELLATTSLTLEEVQRQSGFQSVTDFSRVFRKEMKSTPDTWRKDILTTG